MSDETAFLSRWSRLKRRTQVVATPETPSVEAVKAEPSEVVDDPAGLTNERDLAAAAPGPAPGEDMLELPPIETLMSASDFRPFMRPGVPDALRLAALRRLWALDPAIRDFVSPALDYAWDWNAPGGVPGAGPLLDSDDVQRLAARIFGDDTATATDSPENESKINAVSTAITPDPVSLPSRPDGDGRIEPVEPQDASPPAVAERHAAAAPAQVRTKRHGSAAPA